MKTENSNSKDVNSNWVLLGAVGLFVLQQLGGRTFDNAPLCSEDRAVCYSSSAVQQQLHTWSGSVKSHKTQTGK